MQEQMNQKKKKKKKTRISKPYNTERASKACAQFEGAISSSASHRAKSVERTVSNRWNGELRFKRAMAHMGRSSTWERRCRVCSVSGEFGLLGVLASSRIGEEEEEEEEES